MAPVEKCASCRMVMYPYKEKNYPAGTEVVYICRNDMCPRYVKSGRRYREEVKKFIDNKG